MNMNRDFCKTCNKNTINVDYGNSGVYCYECGLKKN